MINENYEMKSAHNNRNSSIDLLRVIGTFLTMLAHVLPPRPILQVRTFDVVMLVFISGICSYKEGKLASLNQYVHYLLKRIKRLVVPTYYLLIVMISLFYLVYSVLGGKPFFWNATQILESFLLLDGIGYVWIVRVYLLMALIIPLIAKIYCRISGKMYMIIAAVWMMVLFGIGGISSESFTLAPSAFLYDNFFVYLVGYGFVILISMPFTKEKGNQSYIVLVSIGFVIGQTVSFINGNGFSPADYKYPPSLYYISYGLLVSGLTYSLVRKIQIKSKLLVWLSKNSFNLYLLHIPCIVVFNSISQHNIRLYWFVEYVLVILSACLAVRIIELVRESCVVWIRKCNNGKIN